MSSRVKVFNHKWQEIFASDDYPRHENVKLYKRIGQTFHVPPQLLWIGKQPDVAAQFILSLAYARETTKPEDRAYSLMGLLGVRMDVQYGEGAEKACLRLLENVVKVCSLQPLSFNRVLMSRRPLTMCPSSTGLVSAPETRIQAARSSRSTSPAILPIKRGSAGRI